MIDKSVKKYVIRDLWNLVMGIREPKVDGQERVIQPMNQFLKKTSRRKEKEYRLFIRRCMGLFCMFIQMDWYFDDWPPFYSVWRYRWNLQYRVVRCLC